MAFLLAESQGGTGPCVANDKECVYMYPVIYFLQIHQIQSQPLPTLSNPSHCPKALPLIQSYINFLPS
jgi:hypothetical protein